jgi:periplasmic copper chaperone A
MNMRRIGPATALAVMILTFIHPAAAHDYAVGALKVGHPWSRATPNGAKVAAGYLSVTNNGSEPDRLTGGSFENAGRVEVHSMSMDGGVMKMAPVDGGLEIKPGDTIGFSPAAIT